MYKAGINLNILSWFREDPNYNAEEDEDLSPREDRVPTLWWTTGLFLSIVMSCAILATMFNMNVGEAILSLVLGFCFSFIGVQSAGTTDVNPISTVAKVSFRCATYGRICIAWKTATDDWRTISRLRSLFSVVSARAPASRAAPRRRLT